MSRRHLYPVLLFVAVALVYIQTLDFGLLGLDDVDYTVGNDIVSTGLSWHNVREAFANLSRNGIWMPLTNIGYMLDFTLAGGGNPVPILHLSSVLLHAFNAVLLYHLLLGLLQCTMHNAQCTMRNDCQSADGPSATLKAVDKRVAPEDSALQQGAIRPSSFVLRTSAFAAFAATAFWALHPLRVESVAWIASRKDVVFAFFTLLGLLAWRQCLMHNSQCTMHNGGAKRQHLLSIIPYLLSIICAALACMSKPTAMVFPALALAIELLVAGLPAPRRLWRYLPLLALSVATGLLAIHSQRNPEGIVQAAADSTFSWRLLNGAVALGLYLAQSLVPVGLHPVCVPVPGRLPEGAVAGLAALALATVAFVAMLRNTARRTRNATGVAGILPAEKARSTPPGGFAATPLSEGGCDAAPGDAGILPAENSKTVKPSNCPTARTTRVCAASALWFLAAVAPTLGILAPFGMQSRADRFTYVPAMGLSIALAYLLSAATKRMHNAECTMHNEGAKRQYPLSVIRYPLSVICVAALAALTLRQVSFFRDDEAFFGRAVKCDPLNAFAWTKLGEKFLQRPGGLREGVECFRRAYRARPTDEYAGLLAYVLAERGDPDDFAEIKTLCAGLADNPGLDEKGHAAQALGAVAFAEGRFADAVRYFEAAEKVFPPSTDLSLRLAASHFNAGNLPEAERRFRLVLRTADGAARDFALQSLQKIFLQRQWKSAGGGQ